MTNLLGFDRAGLIGFCEGLGEKAFRATQLFRWIHQKGAVQFEDMTDLATAKAALTPGRHMMYVYFRGALRVVRIDIN